jgi:hypothetical protein
VPASVSPPGRHTQLVATHLAPDEAEQIRASAADADRSVSAELRRAVRVYLDHLGNGPAGHGPEAKTRRVGTRDHDTA